MGLFGPLSGLYSGLDPLRSLQQNTGANTFSPDEGGMQHPIDMEQLRKRVLVGVLQGGPTPVPTPFVPTATGGGALAAGGTLPAPDLTTLGGFTTRRTQLFGPLSNLLGAGAPGI
jgi:hypothetical protein